jgi:hypothetical protein
MVLAARVAGSLVGVASLPTVVRIGPFDDPAYAEQLATASIALCRC